jgi:two-component system, LytTR family, response regulator
MTRFGQRGVERLARTMQYTNESPHPSHQPAGKWQVAMGTAALRNSQFPPPHRSSATLRTVLVDPDRASRKRLRSILQSEPGVVVVGECSRGKDAVDLVRRQAPDLVFLDLAIRDLNGFEIARRLEGQRRPAVIFVAGGDQDALRAFEVHALDYLLKPVRRTRVQEAVSHARRCLERGAALEDTEARLIALLDRRDAERLRRTRLLIRQADSSLFIRTQLIDWIEAAGKVVRVHVGKWVYSHRGSLSRTAGGLDPERFIRVSRSAVVNIDRVREIQHWFNGDYLLILEDQSRIPSSRRYRGNLRRLFVTQQRS